jgi:demethylmenaquinone methyltransferase/2-methoxy-6-polyprenyl-1,4-benzoquinol methylase
VTPLPVGEAKTQLVRAMFERIAPRYDRMNRLLSLGLDQRWRRAALRAIAVGQGDVVVDLACGTCDLAELAAELGARAIGLDFAREMLRGARRRGVPVSLAQGDVTELPLRDACASAVLCGFALRNFTAPRRALAEAARVLRPGGRLALLEVGVPRGRLARAGHSLWFETVVPWLGALLSDREAYRYLPRSVAYLPPPAELRDWLQSAGFTRVVRQPLLLGAAQLVTAVREGARA